MLPGQFLAFQGLKSMRLSGCIHNDLSRIRQLGFAFNLLLFNEVSSSRAAARVGCWPGPELGRVQSAGIRRVPMSSSGRAPAAVQRFVLRPLPLPNRELRRTGLPEMFVLARPAVGGWLSENEAGLLRGRFEVHPQSGSCDRSAGSRRGSAGLSPGEPRAAELLPNRLANPGVGAKSNPFGTGSLFRGAPERVRRAVSSGAACGQGQALIICGACPTPGGRSRCHLRLRRKFRRCTPGIGPNLRMASTWALVP